MRLESPKNSNYAACVVALSRFVDLENCANVKTALVFGNSIIVGKDAKEGDIGLFFPVETALSPTFLGTNNLYRKAEYGNADPDRKGYFEQHGRIKAVKFRGHKSEGFWIPISSLAFTGIPLEEFQVGMEFDRVGDIEICCKYVSKRNVGTPRSAKQGRQPRAEDRIVPDQFRFHIDTENLRRNIHKITPDQWISISDKVHGTSAIFSHVRVKRDLNWFERALRRLGVKIQNTDYGLAWSSRRVVKGVDDVAKENASHFYGSDIWGTVFREVREIIPKGYTIYGEIIGYTPEGACIQSKYHYGCQPGSHRLLVYRVTDTNYDGRVLELSWHQMKEFCRKHGLKMVEEFFFGPVYNFCAGLSGESLEEWQSRFLSRLEEKFVTGRMCHHHNGELPAEGVVVRVERLDECESFKCKNFDFLELESKMLDTGAVDIEEQQSGEELAA
jgi:hypothetical protein